MTTIIEQMKRMINLKQFNKLIILAGMLLLLGRSAFAQNETVTVGTGTNNSRENGSPFYDYSRNSTTAAIYTSAEIGQSGCITEIAYNRASGTAFSGEVHIYMATLNKTTFTGNNDWPTTYTEVYSNTNLTIGTNGWNTLTLSTPYYYDQSAGSLVVIVTKATGTRRSQYWYYTSSSNTVLSRGSGNTTNANYSNVTNTNNGARGSNRPNIRLTFKRFYFSANATATPSAGGSASVSPTTTNVIGTTGCDNATTTATFSATPNTGYRFLGWSETASGTIISTDNPYVATITSTSTSSSNPTNTTLYARFELMPNATAISANNTTVYVGNSGSVGYTLTPSNAYDQVRATSGNTGVFTVNASPVSGGTVTITPVATGQAILTLVALNSDGTDGPSTTVTVTVKNKVATPTIDFDQIGNGSTATTTITSTTGADIYYTINGANPTTSSTQYTGSFVVNEGYVVRAIAVMTGNSNWDDSEVAIEEYHACGTNDPTISYVQSGTTATVTITAETGATIYYTTNGNNPNSGSSNGTTTVTLNNVADGTTVKAYAKNPGCGASNVVTKEIILSGISGGVVTLNDREDHNWSYYQPMSDNYDNYPSRMCSPYPRNVKITYYGYGTNTLSTSAVAAPAANTFSTNTTTSDVKVGIGEDGHTFVYYKTLERDANNRFPYELIPNPFYVRPKSGNTYTGFYKWRVKSVTGGSIYDANGTVVATASTTSANNVWLDAMTTYYFQPTDNARTNANNATSMTVELEALWAAAEVITGTSFSNGYNSVERNFKIVSNDAASTLDAVKIATPCTYTSFYPNGTTNGTTVATLANRNTRRATFTPTADSKVEYMLLDGNNYSINADAHNLTMGRGLDPTDTYIANNFYPVNEDKTVALNFTTRIECGAYNRFYLMSNGHTYSQRFQHYLIFGSDYDRARGDDSKLDVAPGNEVNFSTPTLSNIVNKDQPTLTCVIKSGQFQRNYWSNNNNAQYNYAFYCHSTTDNTYPGLSSLTVEGGHLASIAGGRGSQSEGRITEDSLAFTLRMRGGLVDNSIYGAASNNPPYGSRRLVFTGGEVRGWIAAGDNGTSGDDSRVFGDSYVYIGGNVKVGNEDYPRNNNNTPGGNVFGAGRGNASHRASVKISHVAVADNAEVLNDIYGGGFHGHVVNTSNVFVLGGTVHGSVFGGGSENGPSGNYTKDIPTVNVYMSGGLVEGGVYGGSNTTGIVSLIVKMQIDGGQVGTDSETANIHGGGFGNETRVNGDVELTLGTMGQTDSGVTVYGDVYGGSALGLVNGTTASDTYHTYVTLNKGTINGSLYGGGLGNGSTAANVYGPVQVKVFGGSINTTSVAGSGAVYGCNNINGAPQRSVTVDIYGTDPAPDEDHYALDAVYGGGNLASYAAGTPVVTVHNCNNSIGYVYGGGNAAHITNGNTDVTIYGGNKIGNVFGGGNGTVTAANVSGNTNVKIYGGTIGRVFGGSNSQGTIGGTISVNVNKTADTDPEGSSTACAMHIDEVYGGGNKAASNAGSITIGCTGGEGEGIGDLYGGANQANITGNIGLSISGGSIQRVFGGNNLEGSISGTIQVDVNWSTTNPCEYNYIGEVFGGGNLAQYTGGPVVNILNGTVSGNVYGGGKGVLVDGAQHGVAGKVTGNPQVNIGDDVAGHTAIIEGEVYGGGDAANVDGTPVIVVNDCNTSIGYLYGGGNAADVNGTNITFNAGTVTHDAFGGGHGDKDATNPEKYADVKGNVVFNVYGGTFGRVFAGSNSKGNITGSSALTINKTGDCAMKIREVYGGGNEAAGNAGTVNIGCTGTDTANEGIDDVYGGANMADITSPITLNITGGMIKRVFGGNNTSGNISGKITVNVEWSGSCTNSLNYVYGGGNQASYKPTTAGAYPEVNILNGTINHDVFGGGLGATAKVYSNPKVTIGDITSGHESYVATVSGNVYGGGSAAMVGDDQQATASTNNTTVLFQKANSTATKVFGGGMAAGVTGTTSVTISNGTVSAGLYGGCDDQGTVGGDITVLANGGTVGTNNVATDDGIFGGGFGHSTSTTGDITVTLGGTIVYGDLYGGSALGTVNAANKTTTVTVSGSNLHGTVFGGGMGSGTGDATRAITNGNVLINYNAVNSGLTGLYGGANVNGNVKGNITLNVLANVGASGSSINVFGGGLGHATGTEGNVTVNVGAADGSSTPTIYGDIYGGSALGNVNNEATDLTKIDFLNGTLHGTIFGGGLGDANNAAKVNGEVQVNISNDSQTAANCHIDLRGASIYGCNNTNGSPQADVTVNVWKTGYTSGNYDSQSGSLYAIDQVFGGGKNANYYPEDGDENSDKKAMVYIHGCYNTVRRVFSGGDAAHATGVACTIEGGRFNYIFGGGNGEVVAANIGKGGTNLVVSAGIINCLFGGSNTSGTIMGAMRTTVNGDNIGNTCAENINEFFGGGNLAPISTDIITTLDCGIGNIANVYGGSKQASITGNVTLNIKGGTYTNAFGGSQGVLNGTAANIDGNVTLNLHGGTITNAFGGSDQNGNITGQITVNVLDFEYDTCSLDVTNIYGGGNVTPYEPTYDTLVSPSVNVMHIKQEAGVRGTVFGGGLGETAEVKANPVVTIGYIPSMNSLKPVGYVEPTGFPRAKVTGSVFGGGSAAPVIGNPTVNAYNGITSKIYGGGQGATAEVTGNPTVIVNQSSGQSLSVTDVFGGGDAAAVTGNTDVQLIAGTINDAFGGGNVAVITGTTTMSLSGASATNLYGGGNQASVTSTTSVSVSGGSVSTGVYGGCNTSGNVGGDITVSVTGGTIGANGSTANVHGGGYGNGTSASGDVDVTINGASATIWGDVYGGSAKGHVNDADSDETNVTLAAGTIHGDLYGGGLGDASNEALVNGAVQVTVNGGTVTGSIYGCNNANGAPQSTVKVDIYGTDTPASGYAIGNVFGGGNLAGYNGTPDVTIHNCDNSIEYVYGGGNAAPVAATNVKVYGGNTIGNVFGGGNGTGVAANFEMVAGNAVTKIYGGTIGRVFGGNNSNGLINGTVTLNVNKETEPGDGHTACDMKIGEVYGGGNRAAGNAGTVTIGCTGDLVALGTGEHYGIDQEGIRYVYGGANQAGINNNIVLNINSGIVENVFGGNNTSGNISGTITVNIEKNNSATCATDWYIGNVYGGGNLASYSNSGNYPAVNIKNGTVSGDVFGGGLGASAKVRSNPVVTVGDLGTAAYVATVNGNVYGGGSAAMVGDDDTSNPSTNNTTVLIQKSNTTVSKVFGGGMAAGVTGTSGVTITDGTINTGVYGGCDSQGDVKGKVTVNVKGGTLGSAANLALTTPVTVDVYGGGYGAATTTSGDVEVNIGECTSTNVHSVYPMIYGDVYGGSALGKVNGSNANTTTVNVLNGRLYTFAESATTANGQTYYKYHGGNVYGGGLGDRVGLGTGHSNVLAEENGKIIVNIGASGGSKALAPDTNIGEAIIDGNVYGCNNTNGSPQDDVTVNIYRTHREETDIITYTGPLTPTFALNDVFGGGNQADYNPTATGKKSTVMIHGCHNTIQRVFGGSNAAASGSSSVPVEVNTNINGGRFAEVFGGGNGEVSAANIYGDVKLEIHGGIVGEFYVGSNQNGSISGTSNVTVDQSTGCDEITITEFYCGGKYADYIGNINAEISCSQGLNVNYLYGGCKEAHVRGNVHLTVKGGTYDYIFGGSRGTTSKGADIQGNVLLEVYGGTVHNAIFGGSNVKGAIGGTVTVNVEDKYPDDPCALEVSTADVYGGGNQADYPGTPSTGSPLSGTITHTSPYNFPAVNIKNATVKNVFGGGLEAEVIGDPQVYIKKGSKVLGNVYGGGNMGEVTGNPRVIINGKQTN